MRDDSLSMGEAFSHWQRLTDEYAASLQALQRGDRRSVANLDRIARALAQNPSLQPPKLAPASPERSAVFGISWRNVFRPARGLPDVPIVTTA